MRILITNDDGICAEGIRRLAAWATRLGEVTVVAPKKEQSGKSQSIELWQPFEVRRVDFPGGIRAFSVDSTPADCIRFAVNGLEEHFDLVLSGMNNGYNVGEDIAYSATCGAIFEAANQGIPAVAVSTAPGGHEAAALHFDRVLAFFRENDLLSLHTLYNVNIPGDNVRGIRITRQGGAYIRDRFKKVDENLYIADGYNAYRNQNDPTLDTDSVEAGYVSVSPLTEDHTDRDVLRQLIRQ